ncbi:MAG TPA: hypothetical protein VKM55_10635 [Candidatus Lokiarchaeia archaeon]|nr:hypothetical protein [Candidatus Lokiarchaeia archaeon]
MAYTPDPDGLVKKAGELLAKNGYIGAFNNYKKAANIYMEDRSYFKVFEVYKMMIYISKESGKTGEMIQMILDVAKKLEDFSAYDVAARMYESAGSLSYDISDFENAATYYETAAEIYQKMYDDDANDEMLNLSGILLTKSAETIHALHLPNVKEKSENLLLEGAFRFGGLQSRIPVLEKKAIADLEKENFEDARICIGGLAAAFQDILEKLTVAKDFNIDILYTSIKARIIHYQIEFSILDYLLQRKLEENSASESVKESAKAIGEKLVNVTQLLHEAMEKECDKEDIERYAFDGMLHSIVHAMNSESIDALDLDAFTAGLGDDVIAAIEESPYYNIMKTILQDGLEHAKDDLLGASLGKLERYKAVLMDLIYAGS